jgi:hypothetical protein
MLSRDHCHLHHNLKGAAVIRWTVCISLFCFVAIVVVGLLVASVRITQEYERGVIFRLGRIRGR